MAARQRWTNHRQTKQTQHTWHRGQHTPCFFIHPHINTHDRPLMPHADIHHAKLQACSTGDSSISRSLIVEWTCREAWSWWYMDLTCCCAVWSGMEAYLQVWKTNKDQQDLSRKNEKESIYLLFIETNVSMNYIYSIYVSAPQTTRKAYTICKWHEPHQPPPCFVSLHTIPITRFNYPLYNGN